MNNVNKDLGKKPVSKDSESIGHKAGDAIERIGKKLKDAGAEKIGQAVYDAGNKLEHSEDAPVKKNDSF
jgi:hypothetical protein